MEWLIIAFLGVVVLLYAVVRLAIVLDAKRRGPTLTEDLSTPTLKSNVTPRIGPSKAPTEPGATADGGT